MYSINQNYTAAIAAKESEAKKYFENNNWKNKLDGSSRPTYNKLLAEKSQLEKEQKSVIKEAETENKNTLNNHKKDLENSGTQLGYFTLGTEIFLLLLIGFTEYRDFRAISQFSNIENHESAEVQTKIVKNTSNTNENRKDENRKVTEETPQPTQVSEKRETASSPKGVVNCNHCSKEYVKNHHKQLYQHLKFSQNQDLEYLH